jgi:hypothetical protein
MKTILHFLLLAVMVAAALPAKATEYSVVAAHLSEADQETIRHIENYLNSLKNISADFMQVDDTGGIMRGKLAIQRPGKMRVTYNPPSKDFIVADGDMVHIWNDDIQAQTNVPQNASLAEFILRDTVHFGGDVTVTGLRHYPAKLEISLVETEDPGAGQLTLIFEERPFRLRQWKVIDGQGKMTGVTLENARADISFSSNTFNFVPPNFGKGGKSR